MKKISSLYAVTLALAVVSLSSLKAQSIAINTDGTIANTSAILDIKSTNKGLLAPRMATAQRTAIATPAAGLLVYDTDTNSFWFYNGSVWSNLSASGTPGWLLTGNTATNPAAHFTGTIDAQPLRFRVNNLWAGEIHPTTGNIFLGLNAGQANTIGQHNTALGIAALRNNLNGSNNVAVGDSSLYAQNGNGSNVAVGTHSLFANTSGDANTGVGPYALWNNVDGSFNTAIGVNSLYHNISGEENTAVGSRALQFTTGSLNTATGASALRLNTDGSLNTANGYQALYSNTSGAYNTANGAFALYSNTTASLNTAIGATALYTQSFNTGGSFFQSHNVAVGYAALYSNNPTSTVNGINNTAIGTYALSANTTGAYNTANGMYALYKNNLGDFNTASGYDALYSNSGGAYNTAIGGNALYSNNAGFYNTAIGQAALFWLVGGSHNIAIGYGSGTDFGSPNVTNTISIGNDGILNGASNQVILGNMSSAYYGTNVSWSVFSDARIKNNIKEDVKGLDFITRLRPVTYYRSIKAMTEISGNKETDEYPGKYDIEKIKYTGFLAQEVEQAAKDAGYDFSGIGKPKNSKQLYTLSYEQFVVPLVKAVQEQQTIIEKQQDQIDLLVKRIEALEKK